MSSGVVLLGGERIILLANIYLTGFMGSGKSTIAPLLADRLKWTSCDTDQIIEKRFGSISSLFNEKGEREFRRIESEVVRELSSRSSQVVALGGGVILLEENRKLLLNTGLLFYLKAEVTHLCQRLVQQRNLRPLISNVEPEGLEDYIREMLKIRNPFYEASHWTIQTDWLQKEDIVNLILEKL